MPRHMHARSAVSTHPPICIFFTPRGSPAACPLAVPQALRTCMFAHAHVHAHAHARAHLAVPQALRTVAPLLSSLTTLTRGLGTYIDAAAERQKVESSQAESSHVKSSQADQPAGRSRRAHAHA